MNTTKLFSLFAISLMLGFAALSVWPDDAEARRFGGGSSFGSRGSRSFSTPRRATTRSATSQTTSTSRSSTSTSALGSTGRSGFGSGLMGGIGGFMLGGFLGSMLFGGGGGGGMAGAGGGMGGGIGLLEILLIGGAIWFILRWARKQKEATAGPMGGQQDYQRQSLEGGDYANNPYDDNAPLPGSFSTGETPPDEITQGLDHIIAMDPKFHEGQFLEGAKMAFQQIQESWSDWSVDRLQPLLTDRTWAMVQKQAQEAKEAGRRDIIEKIQFTDTVVSEAWQESGEDWITVHFKVNMVEYSTDVAGKVTEGDPSQAQDVEEYWTFTRPVGSQNPNWKLAAIQQPGEVARASQ
ncbi:MAG: Tim44 domain-containing protein [Magnetococcales bacterium]|nr:Tim44 domain-containing protein [Magnetococcales bacterium]